MEPQNIKSNKIQEILRVARHDFLSSTREALATLEGYALLRGDAFCAVLPEINRIVHNIMGTSATLSMQVLGTIAHKLEDYLLSVSDFDDKCEADVLLYVDALHTILDASKSISQAKIDALMSTLPAVHDSKSQVIVYEQQALPQDIEIVFVTTSGIISRVIERNLVSCGCRATILLSPWEAMKVAVCNPPDLLITSVMMDELGGLDLVRALRAMHKTSNQCMALLTSFADSHQELDDLPEHIPIIHADHTFCADIHQAIRMVGI